MHGFYVTLFGFRFGAGRKGAKPAVLAALWLLLATQANAEKINVAVASNFTAAMKEIVAEFEKETGDQVELSFGSSGKFFAQISNGAPFYVFFSADQDKPIALVNNNLAVSDSRFTYAIGALALWSADPNFIDENASALKQGRFKKLALANPKLAPYGVAAVQTLQNLGLREANEAKWVQGENIAQTFQFVDTGNAELGFIALSQIMEQGKIKKGSAWSVPAALHDPIRQDAVLLNKGRDSAAAKALLQFVRGEKAAIIIKSFGYSVEGE